MQPLVVLRTALQRLIYPLGVGADIRHRFPIRQSVTATRTSVPNLILRSIRSSTFLFQRAQIAFGEVEMYVCGFEEVILNLHLIGYWPYNMSANVTFIIESLQSAPDSSPFVLHELRFRGGGAIHVHGSGVGVDPLLDFDGAGAIIDFVGYIRCLGGDISNLANEGYLGDLDIVDTEVCVRVGLNGFEDLLDGDWSEGIFAVRSLSKCVRFWCSKRVQVMRL